jgi:predicted amidohydrolase
VAITLASCAFSASFDVTANLEEHLRLIDEAAAAGTDLLVFPEISLHGYPADLRRFAPERIAQAWQAAEPVPGGPNVAAIAERAAERCIHVVYGLNERGEAPGVVYNTAVLTGPDGHIGAYRKVHVGAPEIVFWRMGDDWPVFETAIGKIGILICADKKWPESARELTLRGAEILVCPTASPRYDGGGETDVWEDIAPLWERARAAENGRWFVSSNYVGSLDDATFLGRGQIIDPRGRVLARATAEPQIVSASVDVRGEIERACLAYYGPWLARDRRDETYRALRGELPPVFDR